jgi:hypothetical protein
MTNASLALRPPRLPATQPDGRRGAVYSVRLDDVERLRLTELHQQAAGEMPWRPHRHNSLGAFIVWAAMQWKPAHQSLHVDHDKLVDGVGRVVGRRLPSKRKRAPRKPTRQPGRRRPAKKKKGRRS